MHKKSLKPARRCAAATAIAASVVLAAGVAEAQALTVLPVNIEMGPGQMASTLTVINNGDAETSIQVRALAWDQPDGIEHLASSDDVAVSPPIATVAPGATQVVRLVLRTPPRDTEASYRIIVDQIPPAAAPGTVRLALRLSIPVFAEPKTRAVAHVQYRVETGGGGVSLVAMNDGARHETVRDVNLTAPNGSKLDLSTGASPYILAGTTRRWSVAPPGASLVLGETLHLTAIANTGAIDQSVAIVGVP